MLADRVFTAICMSTHMSHQGETTLKSNVSAQHTTEQNQSHSQSVCVRREVVNNLLYFILYFVYMHLKSVKKTNKRKK